MDGSKVMLDRLEKARIFSVSVVGTGAVAQVCEECDRYFHVYLSKAELAQLGRELIHLSRDMTE